MQRAKLFRSLRYMTLHVNLSEINAVEDVNDIYKYALSFVSKLPPRSMTLLFDLRKLIDSNDVRKKLGEMTIECSKYFVQTAVVSDNKIGEQFKSIIDKQGLSDTVKYYSNIEAAREFIMQYGADAKQWQ